MSCWKFMAESCFCCCKMKRKDSLADLPLRSTVYNVRRISSFGRTPSNEDLEKAGNTDQKADRQFLTPHPIPCDRITITIQPEANEEEWDDNRDAGKGKKRWKKALTKAHKKPKPQAETVAGANRKDNNRDAGYPKEKRLTAGNEEDAERTREEGAKKSPSFRDRTKNAGNWSKALLAAKVKPVADSPSTDRLLSPNNNNNRNFFYSNPDLSVSKTSISTMASTVDMRDANSEEFLSPNPSEEPRTVWMKSQSMQDIKSLSSARQDELDRLETEEGRRELARAHGLDLKLYQTVPLSKSAEAVNRARQTLEASGRGDICQELPLGTIFFDVFFDEPKKKLVVNIEKVPKLAGKGVKQLLYEFTIRLAILPGEREVLHSRRPHTVERPVDEAFTFDLKRPNGKVLRFSIFDVSRKGKYDAIGHALFYLEDILQPFSRLHQMKLYKQSIPDVDPGTVQLSMSFDREKSVLCLTVVQVENVNVKNGKCKMYVKVISFDEGKRKERVSQAVLYEARAVFDFSISMRVDPTGARQSYAVASVKRRDLVKLKQERTVGRLVLGPHFFAEDGVTPTPWGRVILYGEPLSHSFRMYL